MNATRAERRTRATLNRLIATKQLSQKGLDWLIVATDPFHDTEVSCEGFPDVTSSRTIVQCVTQTTNVKTPLSTDSNWDAHVFLFPSSPNWDQGNGTTVLPNAFYQAAITPDGLLVNRSLLTNLPVYAGYNIITVANGTDWTTQTTSQGHSSPSVAWPTTFGAGQVRLIAAGYEVTNTTAEIYKQGSITSYRSPSNVVSGFLIANNDTDGRIYETIEWASLPPTSQAEASLYPNSKTWGATDGIYSIATMNTNQNAFRSPIPSWSGMIQVPTEESLLAGDPRLCFVPAIIGDGSTTTDYVADASSHAIEFDVHGCILAGLSSQTTLQVTTRYYFERIPSASDPNLLVLCKPSPSYDPLALEIYSRATGELPIAVKVGENPLGEWFEEVMSTVSMALPAVGQAVGAFIPGAGAVGSVLGGAAGIAAKANRAARNANQTANQAKQISQQAAATARVAARQDVPKTRTKRVAAKAGRRRK